jgi:uncharacterized cupin superfamily protein
MEAAIRHILRKDYLPHAEELKHLYLVGNLQRPVPHSFFREDRVEVALCTLKPGDDGRFHWHPTVTEYEYVLEGRHGYFSVAEGRERWFEAGDLISVPAGACVRRLVRNAVRTLTVKVPSRDDKIHCEQCDRDCPWRVTERRKT